jgi:hypothetical protein
MRCDNAESLRVDLIATEGTPMRSPPRSGDPRLITCLLAALAAAALPLACTVSAPPQVENPFIGNWATAENASITLRPDTIVQHQPDGESTTLDKNTCRGVFRLVYGTRSRDALIGLISRQPDLRQKLSSLLPEQSYPVAELDCDRGDQTYVLMSNRELLAIYRDGDIGAIDRLARR